jgi:hypothetical protein
MTKLKREIELDHFSNKFSQTLYLPKEPGISSVLVEDGFNKDRLLHRSHRMLAMLRAQTALDDIKVLVIASQCSPSEAIPYS